ncbi:MAG: DNA-processing protein DprA, partial [Duncaniella sp.]|nr:DNA-processing protein DprA [Duncaniella sp.]
MESVTLIYRIAFASLRGLSLTAARELLSRCGSEERFFSLSADELTHITGNRNRMWDDTLRTRLLDEARREADFIAGHQVTCLYFTDPAYPQRLLNCDDAPLMLYALGHCNLNSSNVMAVVGTRHATSYGSDITSRIITDLASQAAEPPVIVSGLALGIDIAAHRAALKAGVPTVAVLAHGLNTIYPAVHRNYAVDIINNGGMLLTDYRSADAVHRGNFLARNRIVAGMSDCLLVTESAAKGGALVTARLAAEYDREVMAVPGRVGDMYSEGCNRLIFSHAARLVTSATDILNAMRWAERPAEGEQGSLFEELTAEETAVMDTIREEGDASFSLLIQKLHIPAPRLTGLLVDMEFKGYIRSIP